MNLITKDAVADVRFTLSWETPEARHTEVYRAPQLNLWRDILPHDIHDGSAPLDFFLVDLHHFGDKMCRSFR